MPELAEVEYYRKRWDQGVGQRIQRVALHEGKRLFRGTDPRAIERLLTGAVLQGSETRGKQMVFRFSRNAWLGVHLGMTGKLRTEPHDFEPGKHDHLVLYQKWQALVFSDARMFGRVRFEQSKGEPAWWKELPPPVTSPKFTLAHLQSILRRRQRAPLKGLLLVQDLFPGVGNWMADEILWQCRLHPRATAAQLDTAAVRELWRTTRSVCRTAHKTIGVDWSDPPSDWLIHERFKAGGNCPRDRSALHRGTVAGRTTAWCAKCQRMPTRK
jgi:formamidopyrimidine-DNA glycosylase